MSPAANNDATSQSVVDVSSTEIPDPLEGIPELTTFTAITNEDKIAALKLIADSIAQQRQTSSRSILFHPATGTLFILAIAVASHFLYKETSDLPILFTTCMGLIMACLAGIRFLANPYIDHAEKLNWDWLEDEDNNDKQDDIVVTKFGDEVIGTIIFRCVGGPSKKKGGKKETPKGQIRGWAVRLRYRHKGIGGDLLEEAIKIVRSRHGQGTEIEFHPEHASKFNFASCRI
jgi:ribosomal protein S18 acetylase RimI-like enzyme